MNKLIYPFITLLLFACNNQNKMNFTDTPTSGEVNVVADESYSLLFDTQVFTFQALYPNAKIHIKYMSEHEAFESLANDSCKVIVINRDLTKNERDFFKSKDLYPKSVKIAEDAIALIVNNENRDTVFSVEQLRKIVSGNDSLWKQVNPSSKLGKIDVVFDNKNSANARYIKDSLLGGNAFPKGVFAVNSNPEVIEYVNKNKHAIGVIGVNWISDMDDTLSRGFLKKVKVVSLSKADSGQVYKPYQAYIKTKDYPLCRDVFMINRQTRAGLGMGFVAFVASDNGQRIILKSGLVPAIAPIRLIKVKRD